MKIEYLKLKKEFKDKSQLEARKYVEKILKEVKEGKRGCGYKALRKLGSLAGDSITSLYSIPSHVENNLTPSQSAELLADHFSSISQEYDSIKIENFPPKIRDYLKNAHQDKVHFLEDH